MMCHVYDKSTINLWFDNWNSKWIVNVHTCQWSDDWCVMFSINLQYTYGTIIDMLINWHCTYKQMTDVLIMILMTWFYCTEW